MPTPAPHPNEETVIQQLFAEGWAQGNVAAVEALVAPDAVVYQSDLGTASGPDAYRDADSLLHTAFPDLAVRIDDLTGCPGRVVVRWTLTGTHQGPFGTGGVMRSDAAGAEGAVREVGVAIGVAASDAVPARRPRRVWLKTSSTERVAMAWPLARSRAAAS